MPLCLQSCIQSHFGISSPEVLGDFSNSGVGSELIRIIQNLIRTVHVLGTVLLSIFTCRHRPKRVDESLGTDSESSLAAIRRFYCDGFRRM